MAQMWHKNWSLCRRGDQLFGAKFNHLGRDPEFLLCRLDGPISGKVKRLFPEGSWIESHYNIASSILDGVIVVPRWFITAALSENELKRLLQREQEAAAQAPRPKDTDEVHESTSQTTNETHGGSGNSGEVDSSSETATEEDRAAREASRREAKAPDVAAQYKSRRVDRYLRTIRCQGGHSATPIPQPVVSLTSGEGRDLNKALSRLFSAFASEANDQFGGQCESPRLDGAKLVRELVTRRLALNRTRREELASTATKFLIAADVSGSCSAASGATVGICRAVAAANPHVTFVTHANGSICEVTCGSLQYNVDPHKDGTMDTVSVGIWQKLIRGTAGAVLFGDADGFGCFAHLWRTYRTPVVWLDSYCCSQAEVTAGDFHRVYGYDEHPADGLVRYVYGVNSASTAALAIRQLLRK